MEFDTLRHTSKGWQNFNIETLNNNGNEDENDNKSGNTSSFTMLIPYKLLIHVAFEQITNIRKNVNGIILGISFSFLQSNTQKTQIIKEKK